jgi:hypothetical protein
MLRWTGNRSAVGRPTREARHRVQVENSPRPAIGGGRPATLCLFWTAAQMAVMTERGVPMHNSSHEIALSVSVAIGRISARAPQAKAQVTTTAQLGQCLARVDSEA